MNVQEIENDIFIEPTPPPPLDPEDVEFNFEQPKKFEIPLNLDVDGENGGSSEVVEMEVLE